jgi:hypothetical protein
MITFRISVVVENAEEKAIEILTVERSLPKFISRKYIKNRNNFVMCPYSAFAVEYWERYPYYSLIIIFSVVFC